MGAAGWRAMQYVLGRQDAWSGEAEAGQGGEREEVTAAPARRGAEAVPSALSSSRADKTASVRECRAWRGARTLSAMTVAAPCVRVASPVATPSATMDRTSCRKRFGGAFRTRKPKTCTAAVVVVVEPRKRPLGGTTVVKD